jgi:signal transduction histidine kinase
MSKLAMIDETHQPLSFATVLRDHLGCGVVVIDGGNKVSVFAGRARQLLGLDPMQTSLPAFEALPAPIQSIIRETLVGDTVPASRQIELDADSLGRITLHVNVVPLEPGRKDAGVVVLLNDLTAVRQLEERLALLDRLANLGTLAATMAHEIKNALVAGKTFIDLLLEKNKDAELVNVVRREMNRIDGIVSRMLKFSGPGKAAFTEVHLHDVLEHSLRLVEPKLEGQSIVVNRSFQAARDVVLGDDYQLEQAFVNLVLNALEAMGANGTLTIATDICPHRAKSDTRAASQDRPHLRVAIRDTGPGVPPENLARLFEPFFTTKPKGTGLGLAITRRIVLEHRGDISVESPPGQGTAFQILLPASV